MAFALEWERAINVEYDADERVRADHAEQRKKFCGAWEIGEVRSKSKKAPKSKRRSPTPRVDNSPKKTGEVPAAEPPSQMDHGSPDTEKARFYAPARERFARKGEEFDRKS